MVQHKITGEKSDYLFHPLAAKRIKNSGLTPRIIILLRDPSKRALSHYYHLLRRGREKRSFEKALKEEDELIQNIYPTLFHNTLLNQENTKKYLRFSYKHKGLYLEQIKRYYKYFSSDQILIEATENMFNEPSKVFKKIYRFLGIDSGFIPNDISFKNVGEYKVDRTTSKVIEKLKAFYKPHNDKLFKYLEKKFPWE